MNKLLNCSAVVFATVFSAGAFADEWSQNDQYYFDDDNDTSSIHLAVTSANRDRYPRVDISVMEIRERGTDGFPSLFEQYMSPEQ